MTMPFRAKKLTATKKGVALSVAVLLLLLPSQGVASSGLTDHYAINDAQQPSSSTSSGHPQPTTGGEVSSLLPVYRFTHLDLLLTASENGAIQAWSTTASAASQSHSSTTVDGAVPTVVAPADEVGHAPPKTSTNLWSFNTGSPLVYAQVGKEPSGIAVNCDGELVDPLSVPFLVDGDDLYLGSPTSAAPLNGEHDGCSASADGVSNENDDVADHSSTINVNKKSTHTGLRKFSTLPKLAKLVHANVNGTDIAVSTSVQLFDLDGRSGAVYAHETITDLVPMLHVVRHNTHISVRKLNSYEWNVTISKLTIDTHPLWRASVSAEEQHKLDANNPMSRRLMRVLSDRRGHRGRTAMFVMYHAAHGRLGLGVSDTDEVAMLAASGVAKPVVAFYWRGNLIANIDILVSEAHSSTNNNPAGAGSSAAMLAALTDGKTTGSFLPPTPALRLVKQALFAPAFSAGGGVRHGEQPSLLDTITDDAPQRDLLPSSSEPREVDAADALNGHQRVHNSPTYEESIIGLGIFGIPTPTKSDLIPQNVDRRDDSSNTNQNQVRYNNANHDLDSGWSIGYIWFHIIVLCLCSLGVFIGVLQRQKLREAWSQVDELHNELRKQQQPQHAQQQGIRSGAASSRMGPQAGNLNTISPFPTPTLGPADRRLSDHPDDFPPGISTELLGSTGSIVACDSFLLPTASSHCHPPTAGASDSLSKTTTSAAMVSPPEWSTDGHPAPLIAVDVELNERFSQPHSQAGSPLKLVGATALAGSLGSGGGNSIQKPQVRRTSSEPTLGSNANLQQQYGATPVGSPNTAQVTHDSSPTHPQQSLAPHTPSDQLPPPSSQPVQANDQHHQRGSWPSQPEEPPSTYASPVGTAAVAAATMESISHLKEMKNQQTSMSDHKALMAQLHSSSTDNAGSPLSSTAKPTGGAGSVSLIDEATQKDVFSLEPSSTDDSKVCSPKKTSGAQDSGDEGFEEEAEEESLSETEEDATPLVASRDTQHAARTGSSVGNSFSRSHAGTGKSLPATPLSKSSPNTIGSPTTGLHRSTNNSNSKRRRKKEPRKPIPNINLAYPDEIDSTSDDEECSETATESVTPNSSLPGSPNKGNLPAVFSNSSILSRTSTEDIDVFNAGSATRGGGIHTISAKKLSALPQQATPFKMHPALMMGTSLAGSAVDEQDGVASEAPSVQWWQRSIMSDSEPGTPTVASTPGGLPSRGGGGPSAAQKTVSLFRMQYEVIEQVGSGGGGAVFMVKQRITGIRFAIKIVILPRDDEEKAVREAVVHSTLDHGNVVRFYHCWVEELSIEDLVDLGMLSRSALRCLNRSASSSDDEDSSSAEDDDINDSTINTATTTMTSLFGDVRPSKEGKTKVLFLQMEYFKEGTLHDYLQDRKVLDRSENLSIFYQVAKGLEYLHSKNIIHRDVKPTNIFVSDEFSVMKIGDFGVSAMQQHQLNNSKQAAAAAASEMTLNGPAYAEEGAETLCVGSPMYSSCEQLEGKKASFASDVFSLGMLAFEIYQQFETLHERNDVMRQFRNRFLPDGMMEKYQEESTLLLSMTNPDPARRPRIHDVAETLRKLQKRLRSPKINGVGGGIPHIGAHPSLLPGSPALASPQKPTNTATSAGNDLQQHSNSFAPPHDDDDESSIKSPDSAIGLPHQTGSFDSSEAPSVLSTSMTGTTGATMT